MTQLFEDLGTNTDGTNLTAHGPYAVVQGAADIHNDGTRSGIAPNSSGAEVCLRRTDLGAIAEDHWVEFILPDNLGTLSLTTYAGGAIHVAEGGAVTYAGVYVEDDGRGFVFETIAGSQSVLQSPAIGTFTASDKVRFGTVSGVTYLWINDVNIPAYGGDTLGITGGTIGFCGYHAGTNNVDVLRGGDDLAAGGTIDTVDSPIVDGETDFAFTVSGFAGAITSAIISCVEVPAFTLDISASLAGTYTADMPDATTYTVDTEGVPRTTPNRNLILTVTDGTTTDDIAIVVNPKSGWAVYEIISAIDTEGSLFYNWTGTPSLPADYDQVQLPDGVSILANGEFHSTILTGEVAGIYFDGTTGTHEPITFLLSDPSGVSSNNSGIGFMTSFGRLGS